MLINEFVSRTGFYPSDELYRQIELEYNSFEGDKDEFCQKYVSDIDLQEKLATRTDRALISERDEHIKSNAAALEKIEKLQKEIESLKQKLEKEQEWEPHYIKGAFDDDAYKWLAKDCQGQVVPDEEAKERLHSYFGFDPKMIRIFHYAWKYEINRHGVLRRTIKVDRRPLHFSTDMNYCLFDCGAYTYAVINGELHKYDYEGEV